MCNVKQKQLENAFDNLKPIQISVLSLVMSLYKCNAHYKNRLLFFTRQKQHSFFFFGFCFRLTVECVRARSWAHLRCRFWMTCNFAWNWFHHKSASKNPKIAHPRARGYLITCYFTKLSRKQRLEQIFYCNFHIIFFVYYSVLSALFFLSLIHQQTRSPC